MSTGGDGSPAGVRRKRGELERVVEGCAACARTEEEELQEDHFRSFFAFIFNVSSH